MLASVAVLCCAALGIAVALYYAAPALPPVVPLVAAVSGTLTLAAVVLIPADALAGNGHDAFLVGFWCTLYWTALLLGWIVTEALCEMLVAGEFSRSSRLRAAIRSSMRLYALLLALVVAAALYLLVWVRIRLADVQGAVALVINCYGMVVVAFLLGRGLVEIPRQIWRRATPRAKLSHACFALAATDEACNTTARRLRSVLHKIHATEAAAPPQAARGERERACWDALLRSARAAAKECRLEEHEGGRMEWGLRSAWAHTLGTPRECDEAHLAKLRRRVRSVGGVARRAWQRRQAALETAADLCEILTASEKGFGGAGIGRSRGLWFGLLRAPLLRGVAVVCAVGSCWVVVNEACATMHLLPPPWGATLPRWCPAPWLDGVLVHAAPLAALAVQACMMGLCIIYVAGTLCKSTLLAPLPLLAGRRTDGITLLRHAAWGVRLMGPFASHFLVLATHAPASTAFSTALGSTWKVHGDSEQAPALYFHGVCSVLTLATAAAAALGVCSPANVLGVSTDPAYRYTGTRTQQAQTRRGERLARSHLAARSAALSCCDGDGFCASSLGGAVLAPCASAFLQRPFKRPPAGGHGAGALGEGLCASFEGTATPVPRSLLGDDDGTDDDEGGDAGGAYTQHSSATGQPPARTPTDRLCSASTRGLPIHRSAPRSRASGQVARKVWHSLLAAHSGTMRSDGSDGDDDDEASTDGDSDGEALYRPSWAPANWTTARATSEAQRPVVRGSMSLREKTPSVAAKQAWHRLQQRTDSSGGTGTARPDSTGIASTDQQWCELTPLTGSSGAGTLPAELQAVAAQASPQAAAIHASDNAGRWRQLRGAAA